MLGALPIPADIAGTIGLSDRTEVRVRFQGSTPVAAALDLDTAPEARLMLATSRMRYTLAYAPRLTLWDATGVGRQPTVLQGGAARIEWHGRDARLTLDQSASYGGVSFAAFSTTPSADGTPPRLDALPPPTIIQYASSTTTLSSHLTQRRWTLDSSAGYQLGGGADADARKIMPLERGPLGDLTIDRLVSRQDHALTRLFASESAFSSGPEAILAEADLGWRHSWSRVTETRLTAGVSEARVRATATGPHTFETHPVAEVVVEQRRPLAEGRVDVRLGARLGPVVNRLLGLVDERIEGTLGAIHAYHRFATHASLSLSQSVPVSGVNAFTLLSAEIGGAHRTTDAVSFDTGVRALWQRQEATGATFLQGTVFIGVTLRAPPTRL